MTPEEINRTVQKIISVVQTKAAGVLSLDAMALDAFIRSAINGDRLITFLVIDAKLDANRKGLLVYILTSAKIIKIEIDKSGYQSSSSYLNEVASVDKKLLTENGESISWSIVTFSNGQGIGLKYPPNTPNIDQFFQDIDMAVQAVKVKSV